MMDRRKNCAAFHEKIDAALVKISSHDEWINGNGKPGAKERLGAMSVQIKILLVLNTAVFAAIIALFFRGIK
jgi:hypothetical protein